MLFVKVPGTPDSAYFSGASTTKQGAFVKANATTSVDLAPSTQAGKFRYARAGDPLLALAATADTVLGPVYPVKQYHLTNEDSDLTLDTITSGTYVVYFKGGEYETDNYGTIDIPNAKFGKYLFLDANGLLTTTTGGAAIAEVMALDSTFDRNYIATGLLWFRLLEFPVNVSGGTLIGD